MTITLLAPVSDMRAPTSAGVTNVLRAVYMVGWVGMYAMLLRRGFIERRVGIPIAAIFCNVGWDLWYLFVHDHPTPMHQVVSMLWFGMTVPFLVQALLFYRGDFPSVSRGTFSLVTLGALGFWIPFMILVPRELGDPEGFYTAFGDNLFQSAAFVHMLYQRRSTEGQTMYAAIAKMAGSAAASTMVYLFYPGRSLLVLIYVTIFVLDWVYIVGLYRRFRAEGRSPWRKF